MKETYDELDLTVIYKIDGASVEFEAYEVVGRSEGKKGVFDQAWYEKKEWKQSGDETQNLDEARPIITGVVKWDGCSHYYFSPEENGYIHSCGKQSTVKIGDWVKKIYNRSGELLQENDVYLLKDEFPA